MAIRSRNEKSIGCTLEVWDRSISLEEWLENSAKLVADPEWPAGKHLVDLRSAENISAIYESDLGEVSSLFSIYSDRIAGLKLAIISGQGQRRPELFANFISVLGVHAMVFDSIENACDWLEIPASPAEQMLQQLRSELRGPNPAVQHPEST